MIGGDAHWRVDIAQGIFDDDPVVCFAENDADAWLIFRVPFAVPLTCTVPEIEPLLDASEPLTCRPGTKA